MDMEIRELCGATKFFEPTDEFIDWIIEYSKGRLIVDVGCGNGHVTRAINDRGGKAIGIDPYMSETCMRSQGSSFMPIGIEHTPLKSLPGDKLMYLLARPCHGGLTELTLSSIQPNTETLYIGLNDNVDIDFVYSKDYVKVHPPKCKTYEIALSIKK